MADHKSLEDFDSFHNKLLGLGRKSLRKSYYPELQKRIEELENIQEELKKYKDHLEELVEKRTTELKKINEQLQREITERKQAEDGLRQSQAVVGSVFKTTPVGLSILKNRVFQRVNKAWMEICGYTQFDIIGHTARLLYDEDDEYERVGRELFTDLAQRGLTSAQTKHRRKNGDIRDVVLTASPLYLDDIFSGMALVSVEDITNRKQAETALRQSEAKFKSFAEQALVGTYLLQDGFFQYVNPKFANMFGYTVEECLNHMSFEILVHPEDLDDVKEQIRKRTLGEIECVHYTIRGVKKDGQIFYVEIYGSVSFHKGRIAAAGTLLDVTLRKQIEIALRESEAKYRRITENMNDMVTEVDTQGIVKYTSPSHTWNLGDNFEYMIGKSCLDRVHPDDKDRVATIFRKAISEKTNSEAEYRYGHADGHYVWIHSSGRPMLNERGKIEGQIISSSVITERKLAELQKEAALESLKKEEEKYRTLISNIRDGVFIIQDNKIQFINESFSRMTGYTIKDFSKLELHEVIGSEAAEVIANNLKKTQAGENIVQDYEFCILRKDRKTIVHVNMMVEIIDYFGKVATLGMLQDITARKQAEAEKQKLEERLNRAEKMEALGTLAGGVAHDLNNILGVLVGYSELLVEKLSEDRSLKRFADNILTSSIRGAEIIQDLLTLARRGVTVAEIIDLNRLVIDYLKTPELERLQFYYPKVKIRTELEDCLLNIKGSPVHLCKTIMNLVSNAAEAISCRGQITIKTENRYLDQPIHGYDDMHEGDYVILTVSDTGRGISANDLDKIFEPFYTKKVMGRSGTGLGLAVVWGTVKDHNGHIDVQSKEGNGTIFTLYFPASREKAEEAKKAISPDHYKSKGESILVVDDAKEQRELAMNMMERLGYRVRAASSGEEAIAYLHHNKVDLIILDMIMESGIDGLEAYRRILEISPGQKAVIVSGFSETDRVRKMQEMGAGTFVRKPYILEKIGIAVRKELELK